MSTRLHDRDWSLDDYYDADGYYTENRSDGFPTGTYRSARPVDHDEDYEREPDTDDYAADDAADRDAR